MIVGAATAMTGVIADPIETLKRINIEGPTWAACVSLIAAQRFRMSSM
jgi:hypothetical protein